jgi:hypothetical protein
MSSCHDTSLVWLLRAMIQSLSCCLVPLPNSEVRRSTQQPAMVPEAHEVHPLALFRRLDLHPFMEQIILHFLRPPHDTRNRACEVWSC